MLKAFNHWTVVADRKLKGDRVYMECQCICGTKRDVLLYALQSGKSKSCGCRSGRDLSKQKFGRLTAVQPVTRGDGVRLWLCKCACGKNALVRAQSLKNGKTSSCGCLDDTNACVVCRQPPTLVDKRDSAPCCRLCYQARSTMTLEEFADWIRVLLKL